VANLAQYLVLGDRCVIVCRLLGENSMKNIFGDWLAKVEAVHCKKAT